MVIDEIGNPHEELIGKINQNLTSEKYYCESFELEGDTPTQIIGVKRVRSSPFSEDVLQKRVEFLRK